MTSRTDDSSEKSITERRLDAQYRREQDGSAHHGASSSSSVCPFIATSAVAAASSSKPSSGDQAALLVPRPRRTDVTWPANLVNDGFVVDRGQGIAYSPATTSLLLAVGGTSAIIDITTRFYHKFHRDRHLYRFLGNLQQPLEVHAARLGSYIAEMMGARERPWTSNTRTRPRDVIKLAGGRTTVVTDRFSAHNAAWNSVDREASKVGRRFKLDDCRVWMRLFFWAVRDAGYDESTPLFRFLQKFIGHFIAVYEYTARPFARLESRWSADPSNLAAYAQAQYFMADVVDIPLRVCGSSIPPNERDADGWLYDLAPVVDI